MKDEVKQGAERDLVGRTKRFALEVIMFYSTLPSTTVRQVLGRQLLRSATSVGAHYREAQRAKSGADFVSKMKAHFKNSMKQAIGWSYSRNREMRLQMQSNTRRKRTRNY